MTNQDISRILFAEREYKKLWFKNHDGERILDSSNAINFILTFDLIINAGIENLKQESISKIG